MITADARSRITPKDLDLLASCLGSSSRPMSLDAVLDRREIASFLLNTAMPGPSASLLFYVLVRRQRKVSAETTPAAVSVEAHGHV